MTEYFHILRAEHTFVAKKQKAVRGIFLFAASVVLSIWLIKSPLFHQFLESGREISFLGMFISGVFFTSGLTSLPASISLFLLGQDHTNPFLISIIAACGSVVGDFILLKIMKSEIQNTKEAFLSRSQNKNMNKLFRNPLLRPIFIILALIIIASPLPDEIGIGLLGLASFKPNYFAIWSLGLNFLGILTIVLAGKALSI